MCKQLTVVEGSDQCPTPPQPHINFNCHVIINIVNFVETYLKIQTCIHAMWNNRVEIEGTKVSSCIYLLYS